MALENILNRRNFLKIGALSIPLIGNLFYINDSKSQETAFPSLNATISSERYNELPKGCKRHAQSNWNKRTQEVRDNIYEIYQEPFKYINRLNIEQKQKLQEFQNAYRSAVEDPDTLSAQLIFRTKDGSVTKEYHENFPWIDLNDPCENDVTLIFAREFLDNGARRIDLNYVNTHKNTGHFGRQGPKIMYHDGRIFTRQGQGNMYKDRHGNIMMRD